MSHPTNEPAWMTQVPLNATKPKASHLDRFKAWAFKVVKAEFEDSDDMKWVYDRLIEAYKAGKVDGQRVIVNSLHHIIETHREAGKQVSKSKGFVKVEDDNA